MAAISKRQDSVDGCGYPAGPVQSAHVPAASIIVPLWQAAGYAERIVRAIQGQTLQDFEAIMVDGGPGTQTQEALSRAIADDRRFKVVSVPNQGAGAARNAGIDLARGNYLAFFDADDVPLPQLLEHAVARARSTGADIVIYQSEQYDVAKGEVFPSPDAWDASRLPESFAPAELAQDLFGTFRNWPWDKLFSRDFLEREKLRFPHLKRSEDLPFTCTALAAAHRIALLDEVLYRYSVNATSSATATHDGAPLDIIEGCRILKANLQSRDCFDLYRSTFTQWAGLACCVNLLQLETPDAFAQAYAELHDGALRELGLDASSRAAVEMPAAVARGNAAGDIDDEDVWSLLGIVEHDDLARGTFNMLSYRALLEQKRFAREMDAVLCSKTYRLGRVLTTPLRLVRGS